MKFSDWRKYFYTFTLVKIFLKITTNFTTMLRLKYTGLTEKSGSTCFDRKVWFLT